MRVRLDKRAELLRRGREPYAVGFPRTHSIAQLRAAYPDLPPGAETGDKVAVAGRVIFLRNTGKLCFARLRDGDGAEVQAMISQDRIGEEPLRDWKHLVDIGDHIGVEGEVVSSKTGELSVLAHRWTIVSKALRPLPVAHKPLSEEVRTRQRYVDLIVTPQARDMVRIRARVLRSLRETIGRY
jgi:lysyl-tRNA synthetase class 2